MYDLKRDFLVPLSGTRKGRPNTMVDKAYRQFPSGIDIRKSGIYSYGLVDKALDDEESKPKKEEKKQEERRKNQLGKGSKVKQHR